MLSPIGRLSYPHLFVPAYQSQYPKPTDDKYFSVSLIVDFNDPALGAQINQENWNAYQAMTAEVAKAAQAKWNGNVPANLRSPFLDGNLMKDSNAKGKLVIRFKCKQDRPPDIIDGNKQRISQQQGLIYAGCYARVSTGPYAYDNQGNRGVSFGLNNVQWVGHGPRIDNRKDAEDEFEAIAAPSGLAGFGQQQQAPMQMPAGMQGGFGGGFMPQQQPQPQQGFMPQPSMAQQGFPMQQQPQFMPQQQAPATQQFNQPKFM